MKTWMVRAWYDARNDEVFMDEMPNREFIFATEEEALAFKKAFNEKYRNHGGWEPNKNNWGANWVPGSPAEGPYERRVETERSVEEALTRASNEAYSWGMEEEEE